MMEIRVEDLPIHDLNEAQFMTVLRGLMQSPVGQRYASMFNQHAPTQEGLQPPYKKLTQAPAGLRAKIFDEKFPIAFVADCGSSGGEVMKHLIVFDGVWRYAETIDGFGGLVM